MRFKEEVYSYLQSSFNSEFNRLTADAKLPVTSFLSEQKNFAVNCIEINHPGLKLLSPDFFQKQILNFKSNGINAINLWEDVWYTKQKIVESRLSSAFGKNDKIAARKTKIRRIDKSMADNFLNQNHLQGSASSYFKYALFYNDEPVAVCTFSKSRLMNQSIVSYRSFELVRYASKNNTTVVGGLGKLLNNFCTEHNAEHIMTYVDRDWGSGKVYTKLGFEQIGLSKPISFYLDTNNLIRHKKKDSPVVAIGLNTCRFVEIYNSGSIKFVMHNNIT